MNYQLYLNCCNRLLYTYLYSIISRELKDGLSIIIKKLTAVRVNFFFGGGEGGLFTQSINKCKVKVSN